MPETIIQSSGDAALEDVINRVTYQNTFQWTFTEWTRNEQHMWNGKNFTIRHDYDYAGGLQQQGGKGYHVNVELPDEKLAYVTYHELKYAEDCWDHLSQRITNDGQQQAAQWFMKSQKA
ncbi:MAG: hypothetical protein Q9187_005995 [Circinaria calcarea]